MFCVWRADAASQTAHSEPNRQCCLVHGSIRSPCIAESSLRSTESFPCRLQERVKFAESKHLSIRKKLAAAVASEEQRDIWNTRASSTSIAITLRKVKSSFGSVHSSRQNPSQMNLLYESFSALASGLGPVSLSVFRLASGSTSDASLLV